MSYYTALINEWPNLTPGATSAKLAQINAMTVTGAVPTLISVTGNQIFNCIVYSEFEALTATQQNLLMQVCMIQGNLNGGTASTFIAPMFSAFASSMPNTITALVALSKALVQPWWQANGYPAPFTNNDLIAAGNLT